MSTTYFVSLFLGVGLAASAGFRVFMPLFMLSLFNYIGVISLSQKWQWVGSEAALTMLGCAVVLESASYLIPFVDNALDAFAVPLAGVVGTGLVMAMMDNNIDPALAWAMALIGGGGTATAIKSAAATTRLSSSTATAGAANPLLSIVETMFAAVMSIIAVFLPVLAVFLVMVLIFIIWQRITATTQHPG